ncbi:helix-turn-helix domain-containing protein [Amphibacillus sp. Q70]|uniref:helix-turn-helix domain-containing protein n=1 Tax=Amphibacillus sp. Q70 TaxID=3453416 RepID=UPI003F863607
MEFNERLQQLRKEKEWTQEQLAEELYVSRTAISKWENGKGYPNIDSLKNLSRLFSISIDELLSGEELISLAEDENRTNMSRFTILIFGILDLMAISLLFLPLYSRRDSDMIRIVSLFSNPDTNTITMIIYIVFPILMLTLGIVQIVTQHFSSEKQYNIIKTSSIILQAFSILIYVTTNQPYATSLLFLFFIVKVVILIKENKMKIE